MRHLSDYLDKEKFAASQLKLRAEDKKPEDVTLHKGTFTAIKHYIKQKKKEDKGQDKSIFRRIADYLKDNWIGWGIAYIKVRARCKHPFKAYRHSTGIFKITDDNFTVGVAADWATDTVVSKTVAESMGNDYPDYSVHMGDIYFVGAKDEVAANFMGKNWHFASKGSFALEGNHEMYSSSYAYFDMLLPKMGTREDDQIVQKQEASFFCLENDYWRIIGLDTGYNSRGWPVIEYCWDGDCSLPQQLINWLKHKVKIDNPNDNRGIVFLCHHQFFSAFDKNKQYKTPYCQVSNLFSEKRTVLWLWGHEHILAAYDRVHIKNLSFHGRCIGHGGMPIVLPGERELECKEFLPHFKYDDRINTRLDIQGLGYNGYAFLEFKEREMKIFYKDLYGGAVPGFDESWQLDRNGNIHATF